jgi:uncharacterized protein (TIGR02118 family)
MVKIVVLYGPPDDPHAFEDYYATSHAGLVAKIPDLLRFEAGRAVGTPDGSEPAFYRIAELWFDSLEVLERSTSSPEGQATVADIPNFATGGARVTIAEVD